MSAADSAHPPVDAWVVAVHASEDDLTPMGTALVIDAHRVLTCAHVVNPGGTKRDLGREPLWVAFPKADSVCPRRRVASMAIAGSDSFADLVVLVLTEQVPAVVERAPLRCPKPGDLVGRRWWAFGFPNRDPKGNSADGVVGTGLGYGWVRLDSNSRYHVGPGFSGGGLWSPDYDAVVAVVGEANERGDGQAVTLHWADQCFPDEEIALLAKWSSGSASEMALAAWGWSLTRDPEGARHWRPRARGVSIESERGYRFRGRSAALSKIVSWLDRALPDRRVLVVTGSPGVGKSAVLGRIVTTADADIRASLPPSDEAVRASVGSVSCAVHAKGKTALEVTEEICRAASARLPEQPDDLAPAIRDALDDRGGQPFNVIIDALDETASPAQAREVIDKVVLPLAETCSDIGAQVIVGTRRRDDDGDLLGRFGRALVTIDLDDPEYFAADDLAAYTLACLRLAGDERPDNPYTDEVVAVPLARRIATMSAQNFLVAGLIARACGLHDEEVADPEQLTFPATVDAALMTYLQRLGPVAGVSAIRALTALAFAEAPGLPAGLWQLAVEAIDGTHISAEDLRQFARSSAANFLVETGGDAFADTQDADTAVYRLFHQALNDALMSARADVVPRADDERALTQALTRLGRLGNWEDAPGYLLRSLPGHAHAAGLVDDLLSDDTYLLHADLRRLMQVADDAGSAQGQRRARLIELAAQWANTASSEHRAALFSVIEAIEDLGSGYCSRDWGSPYRALWASVTQRSERASLEGHQSWVNGVCRVTVAGRSMLASAGADGTVRIWDPVTRHQHAVLEGHHTYVNSVCPVTVAGQELLASAGADGTVRIWDLATGQQRAVLDDPSGDIHGVCAVTIGDRSMLASASAGADGTVRIWDPVSGEQRAVLDGHPDGVLAVCPVTVAGQELLASTGGDADGTVRIWDPVSGEQRAVLEGHTGEVKGVCIVTVAGQQLLASAGADGTVRIWDPATGQQRAVLEGHRNRVLGVCPVMVTGEELLASAGADRTVRIWDPVSGEQRAVMEGRHNAVLGMSAVTVAGQARLASASVDGTVRIWDPVSGEQHAVLEGHQDRVFGVCPVTVVGRSMLASAGADGTVRIWDPASGEQRAVLEGHTGEVNGVCPVTVAGQTLMASGGDGTVRIWDPQTGACLLTLPTHHPTLAVTWAAESLAVGLAAGILVIKLNTATWSLPSSPTDLWRSL